MAEQTEQLKNYEEAMNSGNLLDLNDSLRTYDTNIEEQTPDELACLLEAEPEEMEPVRKRKHSRSRKRHGRRNQRPSVVAEPEPSAVDLDLD